MLEIKPDLLNAKKAENIHPAPSALEYYKKTQIRSYPPMPKYKVTTSRPKKAENRPLPSTLEVQKKNMSRTYPSMSEIEPGLFLGNCKSCYNRPLLEANDINAIVSLTNTDPGAWATTREYVSEDRHKWLLCQDSSTQDLLIHMDHICEFIDYMLQSESPGAVLVHCEFGVSRSPTIVIAYLMRKRGLKFEDALAMVKEKRKVRPSANFVKQLQIWEQVGYEIWEDSEAKVPKAAYQAYLNERAAILMTKGLTGDEPIEPVLPEILRPKPRV
jgi:dual specificity phosphatase 12